MKSDKPTNGKPADGMGEAQKVAQRWGTSAAMFYFDTEGETIRVHLMTGDVLTGVIVGLDTFDLVFEEGYSQKQRDTGARIMISKHAIAYIEQQKGGVLL